MKLTDRIDEYLGSEHAALYSHNGTAYVLITGTGDATGDGRHSGAFAYLASAVERFLEESAEGLPEGYDAYQYWCDHLDPVEDEELARAVLEDEELVLNRAGDCAPILGWTSDEGE